MGNKLLVYRHTISKPMINIVEIVLERKYSIVKSLKYSLDTLKMVKGFLNA